MAAVSRVEMEFDTSIIRIEYDSDSGFWHCRSESKQSGGSITTLRQTYEGAREWFDRYAEIESAFGPAMA